jgi:hypothetical protein
VIAREPSALVSWFLGWVPEKERKLGMIYRRGSRSHDRMTDRDRVGRVNKNGKILMRYVNG